MTCSDQLLVRVQRCGECGRYQYPARELCSSCQSEEVRPENVDPSGSILSWTRLHFTLDPAFSDRLPLTIAQVLLPCGVRIFCFLEWKEPRIGQIVELRLQDGSDGRSLFSAKPRHEGAANDPRG